METGLLLFICGVGEMHANHPVNQAVGSRRRFGQPTVPGIEVLKMEHLAASFSACIPQGTILFHEAFLATS